MLSWGSGREECHPSGEVWMVAPRQVQRESRAMAEAQQEGALDGAAGAPSPLFVLTFSLLFLSYQLLLPSPFQRSQINVSLLFIYMNIYINKYHTFYVYFLIPVTVITVIFFSFSSNFVSDSEDTLIPVMKHKHTHTHAHILTHTCTYYTPTLTHASVSSPVTVTPTHPHPLNSLKSCTAKVLPSHHVGVQ